MGRGMMSKGGVGSKPSSRGSISRRDLLRRVALTLGAVALLGAEPALAAPLTGTDQLVAPRWTAPTLVRQGGGTVTVYSALNESTNDAFTEAFKAANPGVDTAVLPLAAAGELQTRIRAEKDSPKADVFIGGSSEFHDPLGTEGLLVPYTSPNAATVDAAFKHPDGAWTGWYLGIFGLAVNSERWAAELMGLPMPSTWDELLNPLLAGKLDMPDPVKTGGGYIFLA